jgi:hypothetical protein
MWAKLTETGPNHQEVLPKDNLTTEDLTRHDMRDVVEWLGPTERLVSTLGNTKLAVELRGLTVRFLPMESGGLTGRILVNRRNVSTQ